MGLRLTPRCPKTGREPAWAGRIQLKITFSVERGCKNQNYASHAPWEALFFCFSCSVGITICHFWHPSAEILPKNKWQFRCGGVAKIEIVLPMLRKKHFFLCFQCSMGITFLKSTWPLVYKWHFLRGVEFAYSCGAVHGFVGRYRMTNSFENFPAKSAVHAT